MGPALLADFSPPEDGSDEHRRWGVCLGPDRL